MTATESGVVWAAFTWILIGAGSGVGQERLEAGGAFRRLLLALA